MTNQKHHLQKADAFCGLPVPADLFFAVSLSQMLLSLLKYSIQCECNFQLYILY